MADLLPKNGQLGSIHVEYKQCGKPSCKCTRGQLHGPYFYHHFRDQRVQHKRYVRPENLLDELAQIERKRFDVVNMSEMKRTIAELDQCLNVLNWN